MYKYLIQQAIFEFIARGWRKGKWDRKLQKKDVIILAYKNIVEKSFGGDLFNSDDGLIFVSTDSSTFLFT